MSGIVGIFSPRNHDRVRTMLGKLSHRGNSSSAFWQGSAACLGAIGYQIIGEKAGPVTTPSDHLAAVMDGRLVNQDLLLKDLEFHQIDNLGDVELAMHFFEEFGSRAFGRLQGEFALAIADGDSLVLARDRLGIRPLYYGFHDGGVFVLPQKPKPWWKLWTQSTSSHLVIIFHPIVGFIRTSPISRINWRLTEHWKAPNA